MLGAGLASRTAAAALAPRAGHVTVLDRDALSRVDEARKGVPQGKHIHLLVPAGRAALERLLPGVTDELAAAGAQILNRAGDFAIHIGGGRLNVQGLHPDFVLIGATRPLIEGVVRERVRALTNVEILGGREARGLIASGSNGAVTGVRVRPKGEAAAEETLPADLVVDATGRGSRAPRWLEELGYEAPHEESVRIDVRYATRMFRRPPGRPDGVRNVLIGALPGEGRGAVALAVEGDRWIVTLSGMFGEQPPTALSDFRAYARSLWCGDVHAIAAREEPLGEATTASFPANVRRGYDRLRGHPPGFVVLGDAMCAFNPTYGQGMSVATLEAEALAGALERAGTARIGKTFYRAARPIADNAWAQAVDDDLQHPQAAGPRSLRWRLTSAYMARLLPAAHRDPAVGQAFLNVMGMLAAPPSVLRPGVARRVLFGGRRPAKAYAAVGS
ncbi:MAG: hypothetical protein U5K81_13590 [Trueperaceae bacterium]|nr:hypothetical protein [Trueperaceae bacterium]